MSKQSSTFFGVILALLALVHSVQALNEAASTSGNKYPIVLLHGFAGWGRDELGGAKYWGGFHGDWQEDLKKAGYDIRTATVGPFASNWDRACELYAYIKGGTVYYGKNHAQTHNHKLTGRTYPGIFPQWGEVINGEVQKIHIVAHSMGGQTARMLAQLLAEGTKGAPIQEDPNSHPLFAGGKDWIHSISTFATPNQGTLLADGFDTFGDAVENLVGAIVGSVNAFGGGVSMLYDTKLDQWGLSPRQNGENLKDYIKRVFNSPVLKSAGKDLCLYSLSAAGAKEELTWVKTQPKIYYYSATNSDSFRLGSIQLPRPQSMLLPLQPLSVFLGSSYATKKGYSSAWQENDGVVNTPSMKSDGKAQVVEGVAVSAPGRWHHIGLFNTLDHEAVVGVKLFVNILNVYTAQARILYELPATKVGRRLRSASVELAHSEEATRRVSEAVAAVNAPVEPTKEQILAVCAQPANDAVRLACEPHMRRL